MQILLKFATMPEGSGQQNSYNILPYCIGVVGHGTPAAHSHNVWWQLAFENLHYTAALPRGRRQWNSG